MGDDYKAVKEILDKLPDYSVGALVMAVLAAILNFNLFVRSDVYYQEQLQIRAQYVTIEQYRDDQRRIQTKLDKILDKLDTKADRHE